MEIEVGLSKEVRANISGGLTTLLADMYVLYLKTQNFHYNIHGPEFYALHLMSENFYKQMAESIDEVAERIRSLGFFVDATMGNCLRITSVTEDHQVNPKIKMIEDLIKGIEVVVRRGRMVHETADGCNDAATVDMLGRTLGFYEKANWMLRSQL